MSAMGDLRGNPTMQRFIPRWLDLLGELVARTDAEGGPQSYRLGARVAHQDEMAARHAFVSILDGTPDDTDLTRFVCSGCDTCRPEAVAA